MDGGIDLGWRSGAFPRWRSPVVQWRRLEQRREQRQQRLVGWDILWTMQ